jgi:amino acid permease
VLFSSACIIGYLIVCKGYIPQGLAVFGIAPMPGFVYVLGSTAVVLYFNYQSDLSILTPTSMIGNFSIFYTTFLLLAFWAATPVSDYSDWDAMVLQPGLFVTLPTMAFSFNGHFGAPGMYQQMAGKSPAKWKQVTIYGFGLCLPLVLICALSGFFMFDAENLVAQSNILLQKEMTGKYSVAVAFVGMSLAVLFGVPIHTNAVRGAIDGIIVRGKGIDPSNDPGAKSRFFIISTTITVLTNLVALTLDDLGLVVSINGAVTATLMMYILPALMYMKIAGASALPAILVILGAIIGITGVTTGVMVGMGEGGELRW